MATDTTTKVLSCNGTSWFTSLEQIAMGSGSAGPAYAKAVELQSYAYAVRWTKPVPEATSSLAKKMDADLQTAAALVTALAATPSVATIGSSLTAMETLCSSIVANDTEWAGTSSRSPVTASELRPTCGFWHPFVCVEDAGGVLLKWAAIGAVAYFGGKWLLNKTAFGRNLLK